MHSSSPRVAWLIAVFLMAPALAPSAAEPESVVLLHGLGRSDHSMDLLASRIAAAGFDTHNIDYPSLDHGPGELVDHIVAAVSTCCGDAAKIHFVTHSLGGILVRAYAVEHAPENLGRVVMLAPPNRGSEYVDAMRDWDLFQLAAGPTGVQLGTNPESLPNRLPAPTFELGVIAGTRSSNPVSGHVIPGSSDGTVSVESTKLEGMTDFISVDESHTFIMRSPLVAEQTIEFLRNGRFAGSEDR
jgi:pimeloyl-ACP methyl ester carboxylesterase